MLYVIYGSDTEKVRHEARKFVDVVRTREPHVAYVRITPDTWDSALIESYIGAQGLFVEKVLIVLDGVAEGDTKDEVFERVNDYAASNNVFLIVAGSLSKALVGNVESVAKKVYVFDAQEEKTETPWNMFSLGNAWERGDNIRAWVSYHEARARGMEPEVLAGILHATIRRGLEKGSKTRTQEEFENASRSLIALYHNARRGEWDLHSALEHFLTR